MERDLELGKNAQTQAHSQANAVPVWRRHELGQSRIGTAPIAKTQTNFSSLTMCNIPFLQQIIYFMHVYSAYDT